MQNSFENSQKKYDVLIVGAGASGMTAAVMLARREKKVLLVEQNEELGKKILATGNGKCNFTNSYQTPECYRGDLPEFAWSIVNQYGTEKIIAFLKSLGIYPKERDGYWYPYSEQAMSVRDAFAMELDQAGVKVITNCRVKQIEKNKSDGKNEFLIKALKKDLLRVDSNGKKKEKNIYSEEYRVEFHAEHVILAGGGMAGNISGADGSCYYLAEKLGHSIVKPVPALVQLLVKEDCSALAGVRLPVKATLTVGKENPKQYTENGEILFTEYGISGIPTMQLSRYASVCFNRQENTEIEMSLDFFADTEENELQAMIRDRLASFPDRTMSEMLNGMLPAKLNTVLLQRISCMPDVHITKKTYEGNTANVLAKVMKDFRLTIVGTKPMENAQVTAGGVSVKELDDVSLESRICSGVYVVGELADIDGTCGGYNLHWAFASAMAAAEDILKK